MFKRRWILTTLLVFFAAAVMIRLGFWQLDRLAQKRAYMAASLAEIEANPLTIRGDEIGLDAQTLRYRRAVVSGAYDFEREVLLKSQLYLDQPGFHVLTPFLIEGSDRAVLIDRGWIDPTTYEEQTGLAGVREAVEQTLEGRIEPEDNRPKNAEIPDQARQEWYRVDIAGFQNQLPYELLPFYIALTPSPAHTGVPTRNPPPIILDEEPHPGSSIQWFLFAIIVPIVYTIQVVRIDRKRVDEETD
ncbi:MAG: SURF1 family protein [Chloroflexi bacterium]|nr:SURF1 family protein [Chloroflexota bacterium]